MSNQRGVDLTVDTFARVFGFSLNLGGAESLFSVGLAILALAMLMIFGLAGRSGGSAGCQRSWPPCCL